MRRAVLAMAILGLVPGCSFLLDPDDHRGEPGDGGLQDGDTGPDGGGDGGGGDSGGPNDGGPDDGGPDDGGPDDAGDGGGPACPAPEPPPAPPWVSCDGEGCEACAVSSDGARGLVGESGFLYGTRIGAAATADRHWIGYLRRNVSDATVSSFVASFPPGDPGSATTRDLEPVITTEGGTVPDPAGWIALRRRDRDDVAFTLLGASSDTERAGVWIGSLGADGPDALQLSGSSAERILGFAAVGGGRPMGGAEVPIFHAWRTAAAGGTLASLRHDDRSPSTGYRSTTGNVSEDEGRVLASTTGPMILTASTDPNELLVWNALQGGSSAAIGVSDRHGPPDMAYLGGDSYVVGWPGTDAIRLTQLRCQTTGCDGGACATSCCVVRRREHPLARIGRPLSMTSTPGGFAAVAKTTSSASDDEVHLLFFDSELRLVNAMGSPGVVIETASDDPVVDLAVDAWAMPPPDGDDLSLLVGVAQARDEGGAISRIGAGEVTLDSCP